MSKYNKKKICEYCKRVYTPDVSTQARWERSKYCCARHKQLGWSKKIHSRSCKNCKTLFVGKRQNMVYCSNSCRHKYESKHARVRQIKSHVALLEKAKYVEIVNGEVKFEDFMLTLKNYKEPLKKILKKDGYGWYGTLAVTTDGELIQCHKCGDLKKSLPGHIRQRHKMTVDDYRTEYGLSPSSALVSENLRETYKMAEWERVQAFTPEQKAKYMANAKKNLVNGRKLRKHFQPKESLESKNKKGTCPDQLLEKIREVKERIGHIPSKKEFNEELGTQRFTHLIYVTYGSWKTAVELCNFGEKHIKPIHKGRYRQYDDEELLELLQIYTRENQSIPTGTDFKRDFLPTMDTYRKRFKTIENARQLAGVYEILGEVKGIQTNKSKYLRKQRFS